MRNRLATSVSAAMSVLESLRSTLPFLKGAWGYRPEKFYMRGPARNGTKSIRHYGEADYCFEKQSHIGLKRPA